MKLTPEQEKVFDAAYEKQQLEVIPRFAGTITKWQAKQITIEVLSVPAPKVCKFEWNDNLELIVNGKSVGEVIYNDGAWYATLYGEVLNSARTFGEYECEPEARLAVEHAFETWLSGVVEAKG